MWDVSCGYQLFDVVTQVLVDDELVKGTRSMLCDGDDGDTQVEGGAFVLQPVYRNTLSTHSMMVVRGFRVVLDDDDVDDQGAMFLLAPDSHTISTISTMSSQKNYRGMTNVCGFSWGQYDSKTLFHKHTTKNHNSKIHCTPQATNKTQCVCCISNRA